MLRVTHQCPSSPVCCQQQQVVEIKPTVLDACPASAASMNPPKPAWAQGASLLLSTTASLSGGSRGGRSRLITIWGINAPSSLTPIQILTWRAARFPGKQVIQSSCCPVMTSPSPDFLHKHRADPFWQAGAF